MATNIRISSFDDTQLAEIADYAAASGVGFDEGLYSVVAAGLNALNVPIQAPAPDAPPAIPPAGFIANAAQFLGLGGTNNTPVV